MTTHVSEQVKKPLELFFLVNLKDASQKRHREVGSAGSRRPRCEARNTNARAGSRPSDELAQHSEVR